MKIKWIGHSCFMIELADGRKILTDPYDNTVGYDPVDETADIVLVTHDHFDHGYTEGIKGDYKLITKAGEYDLGNGLSVCGIEQPHDDAGGSKRGTVITFVINAEGLNLLHMGDIGVVPGDDYFAKLPKIDILMIPVGGVFTVDAKGAFSILERIHPNITIPMHFKTEKLSFDVSSVFDFLQIAKEGEFDISRLGGAVLEVDPLNLKKRSRIIVMEHSN